MTDMPSPTVRIAEKLKNSTLVNVFKLPVTEVLVDSFPCSISRVYLQQGSAYLTQNFFCFHSKTGPEIKEIIRLRDIVSIVKRNRFALGVEFVHKNYDRTLFSGFLDRNHAFSLIVNTWKICIGAKNAVKPTPVSTPTDSLSNDGNIAQAAVAAAAEGAESDSASLASLINNEPLSNSPVNLSEIKATETVRGMLNSVTPVQVFHLFYSDGRPHFKRYHEMMEDKDITVENWAKGDKGFTRMNKFLSPLKGLGMGPPETRMEELNWYSLSEDVLVVDCVQHSLDIPYNDYFTVHVRWTFKLVDGGNTEVTAVCGVRWTKKTLLRGTIENVTVQKCKEPHTKWLNYISSELASHPASGSVGRPAGDSASQPHPKEGVPAAAAAAPVPAVNPIIEPQPQQIAHSSPGLFGFDRSTIALAVIGFIIILLLLDITIQLHILNRRLYQGTDSHHPDPAQEL